MCRARYQPEEKQNNLFTHTEYYEEVNTAEQVNILRLEA